MIIAMGAYFRIRVINPYVKNATERLLHVGYTMDGPSSFVPGDTYTLLDRTDGKLIGKVTCNKVNNFSRRGLLFQEVDAEMRFEDHSSIHSDAENYDNALILLNEDPAMFSKEILNDQAKISSLFI